jgi:hypothetical protein
MTNCEVSMVFFQSREQVVFLREKIRSIWLVMKTLEAQVGQFLMGRKCPVSRGIFLQEQHTFGEIPAAFFLQKFPQFHQQRWVVLRGDNVALWKIINGEYAVLIPSKNRVQNFSSGFLNSEFLGLGVLLCRHSIDRCFISVSWWYNRFSSWLPIAIGNHLDCAKRTKFKKLLRRLAPLTFFIYVQAIRDSLRRELPHIKMFMNNRPNPLTWEAPLLSYWFSRNPAGGIPSLAREFDQ